MAQEIGSFIACLHVVVVSRETLLHSSRRVCVHNMPHTYTACCYSPTSLFSMAALCGMAESVVVFRSSASLSLTHTLSEHSLLAAAARNLRTEEAEAEEKGDTGQSKKDLSSRDTPTPKKPNSHSYGLFFTLAPRGVLRAKKRQAANRS